MKPKRTILCVDEDERSLSIRKVMLETRGYRVVACSDPGRALDMMKRGGIDLIVADFTMPKLVGGKIVDQLKAISPTTPAIVFAGPAGGYSDGTLGDVFLSKPDCSAAQLLDHVRMALVRKRGPKPAVSPAFSSSRFASQFPGAQN
jgi:two-component system, OmpR family, response regulator CpxR